MTVLGFNNRKSKNIRNKVYKFLWKEVAKHSINK